MVDMDTFLTAVYAMVDDFVGTGLVGAGESQQRGDAAACARWCQTSV